MFDAPLSPSTGNLGTPARESIIQISGGEENQPVNINVGDCDRRLSNKRKSDIPSVSKELPLTDSRPDKRTRQMDQDDVGSECGTEVSSVSARREWLKEFGKQHENKFPKKATTTTATQPAPANIAFRSSIAVSTMRTPPKVRQPTRFSSTEAAASTLVNRMMMSEPPKKSFVQPAFNKPKPAKDDVQATNDGYASVAKLSEWLANDPTSTKKKKHVRRGKNVITKSRTFEKDQENVIIIETNLPRGAVQDRKKLIQGAFRDERPYQKNRVQRYAMSEAGAGELATSISVSQKKDWLKNAFKTALEQELPKEAEEEARSEIITNDAASSLSVSDKKDLFKNAFKKGAEGTPSKKFGYSKAMTDVMHNRGGNDDAAAKAKARFLERSKRAPTTSTPHSNQKQSVPLRESKHDVPVRDLENEERTGPPPADSVVETQVGDGSVVEPKEERPQVDEDRTPVDFRAAREALIQRSKQNGCKMQVVNKVFMKKTKFENLEKESRRRSGPYGLLKPSWEEADPTSGLPSTAYDKKFVPDIAPKKSFEELP